MISRKETLNNTKLLLNERILIDPATAASDRTIDPKAKKAKKFSRERLVAEVRSLGFSVADLLLRFIAYKGKSDAICQQKLKEKTSGPAAHSSILSVTALSESTAHEGLPTEGYLQKIMHYNEDICDRIFELFDSFFAEYWPHIEGGFARPWGVKGREESLRTAQAVVFFLRRREDKRLKVLFLIFVLLLGCLLGTVIWTRFARPLQADFVRGVEKATNTI